MDAGEAAVVRPAMQILMMRLSARPTPQVKGTCVPPRLPDPLVSTWAMEVWLSAGKNSSMTPIARETASLYEARERATVTAFLRVSERA